MVSILSNQIIVWISGTVNISANNKDMSAAIHDITLQYTLGKTGVYLYINFVAEIYAKSRDQLDFYGPLFTFAPYGISHMKSVILTP